MTTLTLDTLTPDEINVLAAEAAGAGAESVPAFVAGLLRARWAEEETRAQWATGADVLAMIDQRARAFGGSHGQMKIARIKACRTMSLDYNLPSGIKEAKAYIEANYTRCGNGAPRPPAQEQARDGVAVEEGEAGAVWLGANNAKEGAAIFIADIIHRLQIIPAWMDDGEMSVDDRWNNTPPYLNGAQLRALADNIADLYQCADCHYWYRGGTICPHCGEERTA